MTTPTASADYNVFEGVQIVITETTKAHIEWIKTLPKSIISLYIKYDQAQIKAGCEMNLNPRLNAWETRRYFNLADECERLGYDVTLVTTRIIGSACWFDVNTLI